MISSTRANNRSTRGRPCLSLGKPIAAAAFLVTVTLIGTIAAGCGKAPGSDSLPAAAYTPAQTLTIPTPTAITAQAVATTLTPLFYEPTPALMDQVWQPPEPKKHLVLPAPTALVPEENALIVYKGGLGELRIAQSGYALVQGGSRPIYYAYQLSSQEIEDLKKQVSTANFFGFSNRYDNDQPSGAIIDYPLTIIGYSDGKRSKTVSMWGEEKAPASLRALRDRLSDLKSKVEDMGKRLARADMLVSFSMLGTGRQVWFLDMDQNGGVYYTQENLVPDATLSDKDLGELNDTLGQISRLSSDDWFAPRDDVRRVLYPSEHSVTVTTYKDDIPFQHITAVSGAEIPKGLQALLEKVTGIYDKYAPH